MTQILILISASGDKLPQSDHLSLRCLVCARVIEMFVFVFLLVTWFFMRIEKNEMKDAVIYVNPPILGSHVDYDRACEEVRHSLFLRIAHLSISYITFCPVAMLSRHLTRLSMFISTAADLAHIEPCDACLS